jgi:nucleotide-binding universal stress UspA family protein
MCGLCREGEPLSIVSNTRETKTVIACTDGSAAAASAVARAGVIAQSLDAEVVVTHVRSRVGRWLASLPDEAFGSINVDGMVDELWAEPARAAGVPVRTTVRDGRPVEELLAVAASENASCIVAGTVGRDATHRAMIGATAEALLRRSCVPVVLVAPPAPQRTTALSMVTCASARHPASDPSTLEASAACPATGAGPSSHWHAQAI